MYDTYNDQVRESILSIPSRNCLEPFPPCSLRFLRACESRGKQESQELFCLPMQNFPELIHTFFCKVYSSYFSILLENWFNFVWFHERRNSTHVNYTASLKLFTVQCSFAVKSVHTSLFFIIRHRVVLSFPPLLTNNKSFEKYNRPRPYPDSQQLLCFQWLVSPPRMRSVSCLYPSSHGGPNAWIF